MDWINKNYEKAALILAVLALVVSSAILLLNWQGFQEQFAALQENPPHGDKLPVVDKAPLEQAGASLAKPAAWSTHPGSLLVSRKYFLKDDVLIDPFEGDVDVHPPIPNKWFIDNELDLLDNNIASEDTDSDGFTNLEEWAGKTDPRDPKSHPALISKLRLVEFIKSLFQFKFKAYDDESFQVNTLRSVGNNKWVETNSQFLKMGEQIPDTTYKLARFDKKMVPNPSTGLERDVSELVIQDTESGENLVLPLNAFVNSPDSYAQFKFLLDGSELRVKKDRTFSVKAEPDVEYKLVDINENAALITNTKTNEQIKIPRNEAGTR